MADASTIQKRPRGRPRKQQQVVAAAEAPVIDIVLDATLAKPNKPAPTNPKKLKDEKKVVSSAKTAPDKKTTKKSTAPSGTNGSVTITKQKAATTKQTADPPAAAAAASITPPSSAPQASSTSTRLQRRKAAEPIPGTSIEPTGIIPSGAKPVEEAIATATNHSKILSELAAQGSLPLQREEKDSGAEAARAEEERQAQRAPICGTLQQEEAQAQDTATVLGDELQRQEELARTASASAAATPVTLSGRSTQAEDTAAPVQPEPLSSPALAITPPPPTKAAPITTPTPPTQTTPITMAGPQPPPPQPFRAPPRQARPSQPPAPGAPKPSEEQLWEPPQLRQWRQKQEQRQSKWKPVEPLPLKYKPAARRVTLAMVAAPIAIVTSWALYDRREFFPFPSARCLRS